MEYKQVATVTLATVRIAAVAQIDSPYSPVGAKRAPSSVRHVVPWAHRSLPPNGISIGSAALAVPTVVYTRIPDIICIPVAMRTNKSY